MAIRTRGDPTNIYSSGISVPSASLTLIRGNFVMTCAWLECLRIYFGSQRGALRAKKLMISVLQDQVVLAAGWSTDED